MDEVVNIYESGNLIVRAMDLPNITRDSGQFFYDCSTWAQEFEYMMNNEFSSVSSTLLIPGVGVGTYKNVGFLVDAREAECFHISKYDSCSNGNQQSGDFNAGAADFETVEQLATYIKEENATTMNEINMNLDLNAVVGLAFNKCIAEKELLRKMLYVIRTLEIMTGITYPIYQYDSKNGIITKVELTNELIDELNSMPQRIAQFKTQNLLFSTERTNLYYDDITSLNKSLGI